MLIIAGKLHVAPGLRQEYLATLEDFIRRARTQPGCLDFVMAADPIEAGRVNLFEQWESEERLAAWQVVSRLSLSSEIVTRRRGKLDTGAIADVLETRTNAITKEAGAMIKHKVGIDEYEDVAGRADDTRGAGLDLAHARRRPIVSAPDELVALLAQVASAQKE